MLRIEFQINAHSTTSKEAVQGFSVTNSNGAYTSKITNFTTYTYKYDMLWVKLAIGYNQQNVTIE